MRTGRFLLTELLIITVSMGLLLFTGCEKNDAGKSITDAVKEVVGSEVAKKGQEVHEQIDKAMKQEVKRLTNMDDQKKQEKHEGEEGSKNEDSN